MLRLREAFEGGTGVLPVVAEDQHRLGKATRSSSSHGRILGDLFRPLLVPAFAFLLASHHAPLPACVSCEDPEYSRFVLLRRMDTVPEGFRERFLLTNGVLEDSWREPYTASLQKHLEAAEKNTSLSRDEVVALRFGVEAAWKLGYADEAENFKKLLRNAQVREETKFVALLALADWEPDFVREELRSRDTFLASAAVLMLARAEDPATQALLDDTEGKRRTEHDLLRDAFEQRDALRANRLAFATLAAPAERLRFLQPWVVKGRSWEYHRNVGPGNPTVLWARQQWSATSESHPAETAAFIHAITYADFGDGFEDMWTQNESNGDIDGLRRAFLDASADVAKRAFLQKQ